MSSEQLGVVAGVVLSLAFSFVPGLSAWFSALASERKQLIMGILLIVIAFGAFGLSCSSLYSGFACTKDGALEAFNILVAALVANQAIYLLTKK